MLKVANRAELARLKGKKPDPAAPPPVPALDPFTPAMQQLQSTIDKLTAQVAQTALIVAASAQQPDAPKKHMEAVVHRDKQGRMDRVTITVSTDATGNK